MASIISAIEETFQDDNSLIKLITFSLPLFAGLYLTLVKNSTATGGIILIVAQLFLLGISIRCTHNARRENTCFLPDFNIFKTLWLSFKCLVAMAPVIIGLYFLWGVLFAFIVARVNDFIVATTINIILYVLFLSMFMTSYVLFTHEFKILDAFNLKLIFKHSFDFFLHFLFFALKCTILNAVAITPIYYIVWLFFGLDSFIPYFIISLTTVINIAITSHYLAQIDYEIIEANTDNDINF